MTVTITRSVEVSIAELIRTIRNKIAKDNNLLARDITDDILREVFAEIVDNLERLKKIYSDEN